MTPTFSFEKIIAWQKAHEFTIMVYNMTKTFPEEERFGLTSQFRRAAISLEANIAEGYKKLSKADKLRFFNISEGSLAECRNYIILSKDLLFITESQYTSLYILLEETSKLLTAYSRGIINNTGIQD
ncbi:MAG: four helix bundle protein [Prevotella sp.]|nr:four helix bundle protein [Prevotella sp.]